MGWRSIRVPDHVYDNLARVRDDLVKVGGDALGTDLTAPEACPRCGEPIGGIVAKKRAVACECGYLVVPTIQDASFQRTNYSAGAILGRGVDALAVRLRDGKKGKK
jgi:hypothetical protein